MNRSIHPGANHPTTHGWKSWAPDLVLVGIVLAAAFWYSMNTFAYVAGFSNSDLLLQISADPFRIPFIGAFVCMVWLIARMLRRYKQLATRAGLMRLLLVVLAAVALFASSPLAPAEPWFIGQMHGFRDGMRVKADIAAIRAWTQTLKDSYEHKRDIYVGVNREDWCPSVRKLCPRAAGVRFEAGQPVLELNWIVGFFDPWGLTIGPETMATPESSADRYILPLTSGTYVWQDM